MGVKISDLQKDRRTLTFPFKVGETADGEDKNEDVTVTYVPSRYNGKMDRELTDARKGDYVFEFSMQFVQKLVVAWDLMNDEEQEDGSVKEVPLPVTPETVSELPDLLLAGITDAIAKDMGKARQSSTAG